MSNQAANSTSVDQLELAFRLMENDQTALAEILTHFGGGIMRFLEASYPSFNMHDAEDVLSIAIHKLWERRHQYDESEGQLQTYLYKIADNTAKDIFKCGWAKARELPDDFGDENRVDLIAEYLPPEDESKRQRKDREKKFRNELAALHSIIDELPTKERQVILSDVQAKDRVSDASKLAVELRIAIGSVRGYRSRAWKTIRTKMRELGYELPPEGETHGK